MNIFMKCMKNGVICSVFLSLTASSGCIKDTEVNENSDGRDFQKNEMQSTSKNKKVNSLEELRDLIKRALEMDQDKRLEKYLKLSIDRKACMKCGCKDARTFCSLARLIVELEKPEVITSFERSLPREKKSFVWREVIRRGDDEHRKMLKNWSHENPSVLILLPFHEDGIEKLFEILNNNEINGSKRALAGCKIAQHGNEEEINKLKKYLNNKKVICLPSGKEKTTIGKVIEECLEKTKILKVK